MGHREDDDVSQELAVLAAVRTASVTAGEILRGRRERREVTAAARRRLTEDIEYMERQARAHHLSELARTHIRELVDTQRLVDSLQPSGEAYWACMEHIRQLSLKLAANLDDFGRG
jgi:hypothetical protein